MHSEWLKLYQVLVTLKNKGETPAVKFLDLIFRNNFFVLNFSKICLQWKVLRNISANFSNILDAAGSSALFDYFKQSANKQSQNVSQKCTLHRPNSITKAMDDLFKYNRNQAWFARALN